MSSSLAKNPHRIVTYRPIFGFTPLPVSQELGILNLFVSTRCNIGKYYTRTTMKICRKLLLRTVAETTWIGNNKRNKQTIRRNQQTEVGA